MSTEAQTHYPVAFCFRGEIVRHIKEILAWNKLTR
jgi:hypothetical protein